jgi:hypothetical protein
VVGAARERVPAATPRNPSPVQLEPPDEALEEVFASLTIKRRRFLRHYLATGNQREAVRVAGYNCTTPQSETSVAQEILENPLVKHAQKALLDAEGLSAAGLRQIHAIHLARHSSPDGGDRDRSLRATALAYKYLRPPPAPPASKPLVEQLLDEMTPEELRCFADSGRWPVRFASRLLLTSHHPDAPLAAPAVEDTPVTEAARHEHDAVTTPARANAEPRLVAPATVPEAPVYEAPRPATRSRRERDPRWGREIADATPPLDPALRAMATRDWRW